jgi:hypothetical protein
MRKCVKARLCEHARQHELEMKVGGLRMRHRRCEQGGKLRRGEICRVCRENQRRAEVQFSDSRARARVFYLCGVTNLPGPGLDDLAPAGFSTIWSFTDHLFCQPLTSGLHPSLANIRVLLMWFIRVHST